MPNDLPSLWTVVSSRRFVFKSALMTIIFRQVLVISKNEPPCVGATNPEEATHIQGNALRA